MAKVELAEDRLDARRGRKHSVEMGNGNSRSRILDKQTDYSGGENADEYSSLHLQHEKCAGNHQSYHSKQGCSLGNLSERNEGGSVVHDDSRILQADEGNKEADTGTYGLFDAVRDSIDKPCTHLGHGQNHENHTLKQDCGKRKLPTVAHG